MNVLKKIHYAFNCDIYDIVDEVVSVPSDYTDINIMQLWLQKRHKEGNISLSDWAFASFTETDEEGNSTKSSYSIRPFVPNELSF